jgi:anthranilate phosphoribosyltransferase
MSNNILIKLMEREDLSFREACAVFDDLFKGSLSQVQIATLLISLKMKGETEDEIAAAASVARQYSKKIKVRRSFLGSIDDSSAIIDTCGTGGSGLNKFNVSTATAFVVSSYGAKVAKHGNKAMSSTSGSADVFLALGIKVEVPLVLMQRAIDEIGIGFLYAPLYHPALGVVAGIRKELATRTIFNILGPLCNPANANYQLLGVYKPELIMPLARVLRVLGVKKALVAYGKGVGDEISLSGPTQAAYLDGKKIKTIRLNPSDFGLRRIDVKDILAKDAAASARIIKDVIKGKKGPARDMVLANSSACFYLLGKAANFKDGSKLAARLIDEGKVYDKLNQFKEFIKDNA